jgi:hypothetical protein
MPSAQRLYFGPTQLDASFVLFQHMIIMPRAAVLNDNFLAHTAFNSDFGHIVP